MVLEGLKNHDRLLRGMHGLGGSEDIFGLGCA